MADIPKETRSHPADRESSADPGDHPEHQVRSPRFREVVARLMGRTWSGRPQTNPLIANLWRSRRQAHAETQEPWREDEHGLMRNLLAFANMSASACMRSRADLVAFPLDASLKDVREVLLEKPHGRYPVYERTLDNIKGVVHIKNLLPWLLNDRQEFSLAPLLRPVQFAVPNMKVPDLLREMRVTSRHLAVVVDEHGGVDGFLTIEDLVEEIVGEIREDSGDTPPPLWRIEADGSLWLDARMPILNFEHTFGMSLRAPGDVDEDVETLGGLVNLHAGRVLKAGETVCLPTPGPQVEMEVTAADPQRLRALRMRRTEALRLPMQ